MDDQEKIAVVLESLGFKNPSRMDELLVRRHIQKWATDHNVMAEYTGFLLMEVGAENREGIINYVKMMLATDMNYVHAYLAMRRIK